MITGYFLRVKRDGKWQSLDIAELSEAEITECLKDATPEKRTMWVVALVKWIQENTVPAESEIDGINK